MTTSTGASRFRTISQICNHIKQFKENDMITLQNTKVSQDNDPSDDDIDEDEEKRKDEKKLDTEVIESVPKKFRQKTALIIQRLRTSGNFEWSNEHTVIIGGGLIPQSNIVDLMVPADVTLHNVARAQENIKQRYDRHIYRNPKYNIGNLVRISKTRSVFAECYKSGWTLELFRIVRISCTRQPPVYFLRDLADEDIDGFFYEEELSRVNSSMQYDPDNTTTHYLTRLPQQISLQGQ
ncbi:uncharacterized protein LOC111643598 [Copidosoma floridanum]|uniref:uncharacterized protein LOC111643598 n=1 Tax=Copidosoma floridanum TaxID=29053 RepID=UPI000C6FBBA0|nr:uncharacterized protein LOC111643598 [Copidosoma floridanum]